jgi:hybrid cluster-associated redox disulfide protein
MKESWFADDHFAAAGAMCTHDIDNPDMPPKVLFERRPGTASVVLAHGMLCFRCPITLFHTVIDAPQDYGLDEKQFCQELRAAASPRPS